MGGDKAIRFVLSADGSGLASGLRGAEKSVGGLRTAAGALAGALSGALATGALAAVSANAKLNKSMANVETLIPGATGRIDELRESVQELSIQTGKSTEDLSAGLYQVVSAFGDTADTAAILDTNARAAAAGLSTTEEAIALTSAVTKGYGDTSAEAVQKAADLAFQTVKLGQTSFPELAGAIGQVTPLASEFGVTQEELFGIMATGTGVTGSASEVSTQLRGVIASLIKPSAELADAYAAQGIESGKALIESRGLTGALDFVSDAAARGGGEMTDLGITTESVGLALALTGSQSEVVREKTAAMSEAVGASEEAFRTQTEGVDAAAFKLSQWKNAAVVFAQEAGDAIENTFGSSVTAGILGLSEFGSQVLALAPQGAMIVTALGGVSGVMKGVGIASRAMWLGITGPVGLAVAALAGIGLAVWAFRDKVWNLIQSAWDPLMDKISAFLPIAEPIARMWGIELPDNLDAFKMGTWEANNALEAQIEMMPEYKGSLEEATEQLKQAEEGMQQAKDAGNDVDEAVQEWTEGLKRHIAQLKLAPPAIEATTGATKTLTTAAFDLSKAEDTARVSLEELIPGLDGVTAAADRQAGAYEKLYYGLLGYVSEEERAAAALAESEKAYETLYWASLGYSKATEVATIDVKELLEQIGQIPPTAEEAKRHLDELGVGEGQSLGGQLLSGLKQTFSPENVGQTLSRAFESGGDWKDAAKSLGAQAGGEILGTVTAALSKAGPWGKAAAMGIQIFAAIAVPLWNKVFGSLSEEAIASKDEFYAAVQDSIRQTASSEERYQDRIAHGWRERDAAVITFFQDQAIASGRSLAEADQQWHAYHEAMKEGDTEAMEAIQANVMGWTDAVDAATAAAAERWQTYQDELASIEADRAAKRLEFELEAIDEAEAAKMEALKEARTAALDMLQEEEDERMAVIAEGRRAALDAIKTEMKGRLEELKAEHAAELAEIKAARAAHLGVYETAIARELEDERIKVRLRLDLAKAGGDAEAVLAAHQRAEEAKGRLEESRAMAAAMKEAEDRIRAKYKDQMDAINEYYDGVEDETGKRHEAEIKEVEDHYGDLMTAEEEHWDDEKEKARIHFQERRDKINEFHDDVEEDWRKHFDEQRSIAKYGHDGSLAAWEKYFDDQAALAKTKYEAAEALATTHAGNMAAIVPGGGGGGGGGAAGPELGGEGGGRAMGGPVTAGVTYMIGERGPELFTPSSSGSVSSNADLRALIRAVEQLAKRPNIVYLDKKNITRTVQANFSRELHKTGGSA